MQKIITLPKVLKKETTHYTTLVDVSQFCSVVRHLPKLLSIFLYDLTCIQETHQAGHSDKLKEHSFKMFCQR